MSGDTATPDANRKAEPGQVGVLGQVPVGGQALNVEQAQVGGQAIVDVEPTVDAPAMVRTEAMIAAIVPMLEGLRHVAVGASSPIPASSALLARARSGGRLKVSLLGSAENNPFTDGAKELFDCAAQGRIDAFFLSGGQIDGAGNINLMGIGNYPELKARFPGTFGSAYLYHLISRVILFREEHSPRTLVERVDFVSAAGRSPEHTYRTGGPYALVTGLAAFRFRKASGDFELVSVHDGISVGDVKAATGFTFDCHGDVPVTPALDARSRDLLFGDVSDQVSEIYAQFADRLKAYSVASSTG